MEDLINARCGWAGTDELYLKYHDEEWGQPVTDDRTLFEFLVLESAQAGLSWITILRKREGYREAFHHFDVEKVAQMTQEDIERLMQYDGIVKNRLKINSTINNAKLFIAASILSSLVPVKPSNIACITVKGYILYLVSFSSQYLSSI